MYLVEVFFDNQAPTATLEQSHWINQVIEQWRYNGQIIGREIPLFFAQQQEQQGFGLRVICPEQHSLLPENNSQPVQQALWQAEQQGLWLDSIQIIADDLNSDSTCSQSPPPWQIIYTTYLQSCSPLHSGEDFMPIPLYQQLKNQPHLAIDLIKWQENWQACDQLQMNASGLETLAIEQMADTGSSLFKHGYALAQQIENHTHIPTYYYLYRIGGTSLAQEQQRRCPICQKKWHLSSPLFDLFHFKCDDCRLVSNLSWNY